MSFTHKKRLVRINNYKKLVLKQRYIINKYIINYVEYALKLFIS